MVLDLFVAVESILVPEYWEGLTKSLKTIADGQLFIIFSFEFTIVCP